MALDFVRMQQASTVSKHHAPPGQETYVPVPSGFGFYLMACAVIPDAPDDIVDVAEPVGKLDMGVARDNAPGKPFSPRG